MQSWQKLHDYLVVIDKNLDHSVEITLIGGSALILEYNCPRVTYDIDILNSPGARELTDFIEKHQDSFKKHNIPIQSVDASFFPIRDEYMEMRREYSKGSFKFLKIFILDIYDLILSKLDRCSSKDRDDIAWLKNNFSINANSILNAYKEGRLNALNADRVDLNFIYIMEVVFGVRINKNELS